MICRNGWDKQLFTLQTEHITSMVKNISEVLSNLELFTNALANKYLPFVVNWDTMSEEEKEEMLNF